MCGIMADMQIIFNLMKKIMPKILEILEEKEESCGNYIGYNLINQGLNNIFSNNMLNNDTSLLIWDLLFLEGNLVLIKTILAIYAILSPILLKSQRSIETFKKIFDKDLKKIKRDNDELINYLFFKKFDFDENYINEERIKLSIQISDAFENDTIDNIKSKLKISYFKHLDAQLDKTINCNKNWPYCVNDTYFENVTQISFYTTLSKQKISEYKDNYFFEGLQLKNEIKLKEKMKGEKKNKIIIEEDDRYNILIERRPHYCSQASEDIKIDKKSENEIGNNIEINKEIEENSINENSNDKNKKINKNELISDTPSTYSIKSELDEINEEDIK